MKRLLSLSLLLVIGVLVSAALPGRAPRSWASVSSMSRDEALARLKSIGSLEKEDTKAAGSLGREGSRAFHTCSSVTTRTTVCATSRRSRARMAHAFVTRKLLI